MSSIFLEKTRQLLKERPRHITLALIAEETNLTSDWLETLLYKKDKPDKIFDPGVIKIETLYNYLSDKPFSFEIDEEGEEESDN